MKNFLPLYVFLFLASFVTLKAQNGIGNVVPNPSFESYINAPSSEGDIYEAVGYDNLNGGTAYPNATPDYFHINGTGDAQLPNTYAGTVAPLDGQGVAGFITYNFFVPNYREYLGVALNNNLEIGKDYSVSFWMTNSSGNHYASMGSNNIGVAFFNGQPSQNVSAPILVNPQVEISTVTHTTSWTQYSFTFTATSNFDYMVIGNFRDDANTQRAVFTTGYSMAYYFIDMLDVQEVNPLAIDGLDLYRGGMEDGIDLQWNFPSDRMNGEWYLERSTDQNSFRTLASYTEANGNLSSDNMEFVDESAFPNLNYFYRLRHVDVNGSVEFSDLVVANYKGELPYAAGQVFPNPVQDNFNMQFAAGEEGNVDVTIVDQSGKTIYEDSRGIEVGEHILSYQFENELSEGIYYATFQFQGQSFTRKLMAASMN